jgi:hypothetical protein
MIYDPRLTGYGDTSRHHLDATTGQPRFDYSDIDAHRQNRFITRHALDHTNFGLRDFHGGQELSCDDVRGLAQDAFTEDALAFRTDLQNSLMQKSMHRSQQLKKAPLSRNKQL